MGFLSFKFCHLYFFFTNYYITILQFFSPDIYNTRRLCNFFLL